MKFSTLLAIAAIVPTIGLTTSVRADQATVSTVIQDVKIEGNGNRVRQSSRTSIENGSTKNRDSSGTDVLTRQRADILGDGNTVNQKSETRVRESRRQNQ
jgi:hypothetical protein